ncbi:MAG: hypothetical protein AB1744_00930 [Candidatus Zixiibacteriota bacterium]
MPSPYEIERTASTVYLDARGNAVQGYIVYVHLLDYDELLDVRVPNLKKETVKAALDALVSNRDALRELGKPPTTK